MEEDPAQAIAEEFDLADQHMFLAWYLVDDYTESLNFYFEKDLYVPHDMRTLMTNRAKVDEAEQIIYP